MALSDIPLKTFLDEPVVPYESDEVTRLIADEHHADAFAPVAHLTVGDFRDGCHEHATGEILAALGPGLTPEMAAAVSKIMCLQDLVYLVAAKIRVVTRFRSNRGSQGGFPMASPIIRRMTRRASPPGYDGRLTRVATVIGINPVSDNLESVETLLRLLDHVRESYRIPT